MYCSECMAWNGMENQPEWGECRRRAPIPRTGPDSSAVYGPFNFRGIWPYTRAVDFCHDWLAPMEMEMMEEMEMPMGEMPEPVDQALTPDKFSPDTSFGSIIEQAKRIAMGEENG